VHCCIHVQPGCALTEESGLERTELQYHPVTLAASCVSFTTFSKQSGSCIASQQLCHSMGIGVRLLEFEQVQLSVYSSEAETYYYRAAAQVPTCTAFAAVLPLAGPGASTPGASSCN
jgi:hypothetical protein